MFMPSAEPGTMQRRVDLALLPANRSGRAIEDFHSANTYLADVFRALLHFNLPPKIFSSKVFNFSSKVFTSLFLLFGMEPTDH